MRNKMAGMSTALLAMLAILGLGLFVACGPGSSPGPGDSGSRQATSGLPNNGASPIEVQDQKSEPASSTLIDVVREQRADPAETPALPTAGPESDTSLPMAGSRELVVDPTQYRQLLPRDAIAPVYEPRFTTAESAFLAPDALVIGVEINGESKAYPVSPLIFREMVNDTVGGVPVLVTW